MRVILCALLSLASQAGCQEPSCVPPDLEWPKRAADMVHAVLEADRAVYTKKIVNRLTRDQPVLEASEQWKSEHGKLPLPAQVFRMGAERVLEARRGLSYVLLSSWPINKQNRARTQLEIRGLASLDEDPSRPFYGTEDLGGERYFTAIYPDVAVAPACVSCHNEHRDSPRRDFEIGDVMGAVVIRFPLCGGACSEQTEIAGTSTSCRAPVRAPAEEMDAGAAPKALSGDLDEDAGTSAAPPEPSANEADERSRRRRERRRSRAREAPARPDATPLEPPP